jgi:hypothetical protein
VRVFSTEPNDWQGEGRMSIIEKIDFRLYTQGVAIVSAYARPLARRLANAAPDDADASEREALVSIAGIADHIKTIRWARASRAPSRVGPLRHALMREVMRLHDVLHALSTLPREHGPRGARAGSLLGAIFPDGTRFITGDAELGWDETEMRVAVMTARREEIAEVVGGPELVVAIEEALGVLGDALGVGPTPREVPSRETLRAERKRLSLAIAAYCRLLSGKVREDDETSVERFLRAVAPLDEYRVTRRITDVEEGEEDGEEEVVVAPAPPAPA